MNLQGANLPAGSVFRFEPPGAALPGDTVLSLSTPRGVANPVTVRVGDVPEVMETEPNHDIARIPDVTVPAALNGVLEAADEGDVDLFRLKAAPSHQGLYRITAFAARIGSPADPVLTVLNDKGDPQGEDDDKLGRDARIERAIDSRDGIVLAVRDYYNRGGPRFVYRVEIEPLNRRGVTVTADLGSRTVPRSGSVALPLTLERRGYDGPVTVLAGSLPSGVSAAPVTLTAKSSNAFLILSAEPDAPLGPFPLHLTTRDTPMPVEVNYRERLGTGDPAREVPAEMPAPVMAVAEPAILGVRIEPAEIALNAGGQATFKIRLDRRGDPARKGVMLLLFSPDGDLGGLEPVPKLNVAADGTEAAIALKARADAPTQFLRLVARAVRRRPRTSERVLRLPCRDDHGAGQVGWGGSHVPQRRGHVRPLGPRKTRPSPARGVV